MIPKVQAHAEEIKHTTTGRVLSMYLEEKLKDVTKSMITTKDNDALRQLQGRAQELDQLITFFKAEQK